MAEGAVAEAPPAGAERPAPEPMEFSQGSFTAASSMILGEKRGTGLFAAVAVFSNILAGPGLLSYPAMVQQSGWVVSLVCILLFAVLTQRSGALLAKAISAVAVDEWEDGKSLTTRYELSSVVESAFGRAPFFVFQVFLNVSMLLLDLASIVVVANALDDAFVALFRDSLGLQLVGEGGVKIMHSCRVGDDICADADKWAGAVSGISLGYCVTMILCVPLTLTNFADMMWFQYVAMAVTVLSIMMFVIECLFPMNAAPVNVAAPPAFGPNPSLAVSTCFFSFAIGFAVPSWWNDNNPSCDGNKALGVTLAYATCCYYLPLAFVPAIVFAGQFADPSVQNALFFFYDQDKVSFTCQMAAYVFAVVGIMPNVVAYSVAMRDNVQALGPWFTFKRSFFLTCLCPWIFAWLLYFGDTLNNLVNTVAIGSNGIVNYMVPLALVLQLARQAVASRARGRAPMLAESGEGGAPLTAAEADALALELKWRPDEVWQAWGFLSVAIALVVVGYILVFAA